MLPGFVFEVCVGLFRVYVGRALWSVFMALLSVCRALLSVFGALLSACRHLLSVRKLLCVYVGLF